MVNSTGGKIGKMRATSFHFLISATEKKQLDWNWTETKQFAKQTSGPWKTLVNIMNGLYCTKSCKLMMFGCQKIHLNKN